MYTQSQIEILAALDVYFAETPQSDIEADVQAVTLMDFEGSTAKDYFAAYPQHFNADLLEMPTDVYLDESMVDIDPLNKKINVA
jgi:hypothetical protein